MNRLELVEKFREYLFKAERDLWNMPEAGYKEFKTDAYMKKEFRRLGYDLIEAENITGFYTVVDTGRVGPTVLVLAELDALYSSLHPDTDKETGCVHACGHNVQCSAMLGLASVLKEDGALDGLSGKIKLCVVPAEEGIEMSFRQELVKKGIIKFLSGKPEFISRRFFDDVDVAFMFHTHSKVEEGEGKCEFYLSKGSNGVIRKKTVIKGKATHAGGNPYEGINALNALSLVLSATNSLRETFREKNYVRFHSIVTKGGSSVNVVPDEVILESYVRGATVDAVKEANDKINRAIASACSANGCGCEITDMAGSEPLTGDENLANLACEVFEEIVGKDGYYKDDMWFTSSTDMGDISTLFPAIHAYVVCADGAGHSKDYQIVDKEIACVKNVKAQYGILIKLLSDDGKRAYQIKKEFKPVFNSVDEYLAHKNTLSKTKDAVKFNSNGTITIDYK